MTVENIIGELQGFYYIGADGYPYVFPAVMAGSILGDLIVAFEFVLMLFGFYKMLDFISYVLAEVWADRGVDRILLRFRYWLSYYLSGGRHNIRKAIAWLVSPVMVLARFRFSKNWRHAETGAQAFIYNYAISTVSANWYADRIVEFFITEKGTDND